MEVAIQLQRAGALPGKGGDNEISAAAGIGMITENRLPRRFGTRGNGQSYIAIKAAASKVESESFIVGPLTRLSPPTLPQPHAPTPQPWMFAAR
jgi:hypothetical protein